MYFAFCFFLNDPPTTDSFTYVHPLSLHDALPVDGLSYEYIAGALPRHDSAAASGRTVVAHLGNGASLCTLDAGRSRACTMGFSTLDGLDRKSTRLNSSH